MNKENISILIQLLESIDESELANYINPFDKDCNQENLKGYLREQLKSYKQKLADGVM
jgi:hypothetical protein